MMSSAFCHLDNFCVSKLYICSLIKLCIFLCPLSIYDKMEELRFVIWGESIHVGEIAGLAPPLGQLGSHLRLPNFYQ